MSEYLERTNASKPTFGDYVTLEMKRYGVPNEYFIHEVMTHPFTSNSWRNVPIDARDPEEHLHDTSETVISVCTQGFHLSGCHLFNVRLSDVLPMKGDKWAWQESPLRSRIAELEAAQRWIPVSERLPEDGEPVLAAYVDTMLTAAYYRHHIAFGGVDNWWDVEGCHTGNPTHWLPLPESPEVQE